MVNLLFYPLINKFYQCCHLIFDLFSAGSLSSVSSPASSCALSAVYFSWPAQVQIFRQTKISQKFIKKSSFYPLLGLTCFILRWKVNKFKLVFLVMDELAKSGVRTRKRNKSIKDSAKLVSHRIYLKKCEIVAYIKLIFLIFKYLVKLMNVTSIHDNSKYMQYIQ